MKNTALSLVFPIALGVLGGAEKIQKVDSHLVSVSKNVSQVLTQEKEIVYNKIPELSGNTIEQKAINANLPPSKTIDLELVADYKIQKNITSIGKNEFNFFIDFFNLYDVDDILIKIKSIQSDNGLKQDELLGEETLGVLYLKYYSKIDKSKLPFDILKRFEIYKEMRDYTNHPKRGTQYGIIKPSRVPNVFDKEFYYGDGVGVNIPGTYINEELFSKVEKTIKKTGVISKIIKVDGKFVVATYVNQKLTLLSYSSPGSSDIEGGIKTHVGKFNTTFDDMYYISSAKKLIIITKDGAIGPVMPYALHIVNGIYSHMGYVDGEEQSHGCVRLPFLFAKGLYEIYKNIGSMSREITVN